MGMDVLSIGMGRNQAFIARKLVLSPLHCQTVGQLEADTLFACKALNVVVILTSAAFAPKLLRRQHLLQCRACFAGQA